MNIMLIVDLVLIGLLIGCVILGLITKLRSSIISLIAFAIPVLIIFMFLEPITKSASSTVFQIDAIKNILMRINSEIDLSNIPSSFTIPDLITNLVSNYLADSGAVIDADMEALIASLGYALTRMIIYFCSVVLVVLAELIIIFVIKLVFGSVKIGARRKPLFGVLCRLCKFAFIFIFIFLPFYGGVSAVSTVCQEIVDVNAEDKFIEDTTTLENIATYSDQSFVQKNILSMFDKEGETFTATGSYFINKALTLKVNTNDEVVTVKISDELDYILGAMPTIVNVINGAKSTEEQSGFSLAALKNVDVEKITNLIEKSKIVRLAAPSVMGIVVKSLGDALGQEFTIPEDMDWDKELPLFSEMLTNIVELAQDESFKLDDLLSNISAQNVEGNPITKLIVNMSKSQIIGPSMIPLINTLISKYQSNYTIVFTEDDLMLIEANGWENEAVALIGTVAGAKGFLNTSTKSYAGFDADKLRETMNYASQGVISARLLGTLLNNYFGETIKVDFTERKNIIKYTDTVCNLIKIASSTNMGTLDVNDIDGIKEALTSINTLISTDSGSLTETFNTFSTEILGYTPDADGLTKEEIAEGTTVLQSALNEYDEYVKAGNDAKDFNIDSLTPETKDLINSNEYGELIFNYIFK